MATKIVKRAFNAGEISRRAKWRNDTQKHVYACEKLENFYVSPLGAIYRREGTRLISCFGTLEEHDNIRLVPFEYNRELSYLLAFYASNLENGMYTWESGTFSMPAEWTLCFDVPEEYSREGRLFKKGDFNVIFNRDKTISVTNGEAIITSRESTNGKRVYISAASDKFAIRVGDYGEETVINGEFSDVSENSLFFYGAENNGDLWNLILFAKYIFDGKSDYRRGGNELLGSPKISAQSSYYKTEMEYSESGISISANPDKSKLTNLSVNFSDKENWFIEANGYSENTADYDTEVAGRNWGLNWEDVYENPSNYPAFRVADIVKIPFAVKKGQRITFSAGENFLVSASYGVFAYFANENIDYGENNPFERNAIFGLDGQYLSEAPSSGAHYAGENGRHILPLSSGSDSSDFIAPEDATHFVIVAIGNDMLYDASENLFVEDEVYAPSAPSISGNFVLESHFGESEIPTGVWTAEKTVLMDVYSVNGGVKEKGKKTPLPLDSLDILQYKQAGLWVYFVAPTMSPKRLALEDSGFVWSEAVSFQPSKSDTEESVRFSFSGGGQDDVVFKGHTGILTSTGDFFSGDMVGSQIKIDYDDNATRFYEWKAGFGTGAVSVEGKVTCLFPALGSIRVKPEGGVWDGTLILEESTDDGKTWLEIGRTTSVQGSSNTEFAREIYSVNSVVRARMANQNKYQLVEGEQLAVSKEGCFFQIYSESTQSAWVEIVNINSARSAVVKFLNPTRAKFESGRAYKSVWSDASGWPQTVDIHEERLTLAGNRSNPATVWLSQSNNWDNFRSVSNMDTDPLSYTLASDSGEPISWIVSRSDLMIGLGTSEWSLGSRDAGQALTASIVHASNQSEDGVEYIMPAKVGNMVVYIRRGNREIGSISYDFAQDSYNSISLTTMNPEILGDGAKVMFNQLSPRNNVWVVRSDGIVAVFTYDRENNVAAWGRMTFGEGVMSACALSTGGFKSVFLAVRRNGYLCLERLDPNEMGTDNWLDCAPIAEDMELPEDLETSVRYESLARTTPLWLDGNVKAFDIGLYMLDSFGGKFRMVGFNRNGDADGDEWRDILPREGEFLRPPARRDYRYTGAVDAGYLEEASVEISSDEEAPFELTAIGLNAKG